MQDIGLRLGRGDGPQFHREALVAGEPSARIVEFEVYGAVLGDEQVMDALRARAGSTA